VTRYTLNEYRHPIRGGSTQCVILGRGGWKLIICMFIHIVAVQWGGRGRGCKGGVCGVGRV
jgi:hypothetical protein